MSREIDDNSIIITPVSKNTFRKISSLRSQAGGARRNYSNSYYQIAAVFKEYASIRVKRISVPRSDSLRYLISQLCLSRYRYSASNSVRPGSLRYGVQSTELKS